jgi:3-oxoacyl-[acyl-carrier protein] reductase
MDLLLKDKVVLVTGSTRGIGRAIAKAFLEEGSRVVITGLDAGRTEEVGTGFFSEFGDGRVLPFVGDLTTQTEITKCVDTIKAKFSRIDILVANIGSGKGTTDWNVPEDEWSRMIDMNFSGARKVTNAVVPIMQRNRSGAIVFVSSIAGREHTGAPIHYSVAKAALITFSKHLSKKLASDNIRVNTVCPGNVYFEGGTWDSKLKENRVKVLDMLEKLVPMKRLGTPEEIAHLVAYLSSEKASFITGSCVVIDGGQSASI